MTTKISALLLSICLLLSSCVIPTVSSTGGGTGTNLGPEKIEAEEAKSTRPSRLEADEKWLWAKYVALKARVDPAMDTMKDLYVAAQEVTVAVKNSDWIVAMGYLAIARSLVNTISAGLDK